MIIRRPGKAITDKDRLIKTSEINVRTWVWATAKEQIIKIVIAGAKIIIVRCKSIGKRGITLKDAEGYIEKKAVEQTNRIRWDRVDRP